MALATRVVVGTSERGYGKEGDQKESEELHYRSRERARWVRKVYKEGRKEREKKRCGVVAPLRSIWFMYSDNERRFVFLAFGRLA